MPPRIEDRTTVTLPFALVDELRVLLGSVPPEHLLGLDTIVAVDHVRDGHGRGVGGIYRERTDNQKAIIELAPTVLFRGVPRTVLVAPFVAKFILANALYHELGHHRHRSIHGIKKVERERFAEQYRRQMIQRAFRWWGIALLPIRPLVRLLAAAVRRNAQRTYPNPQ